jgi:hypothetical protein
MTASNILAVYQLANTADRFNGMAWYARAKELAVELCRQYPVSLYQAAGVIAALSPRNKWERNVADAENLIRVFCIDPESVDSVKVCTFGSNKAKAIAILNLPKGSDGHDVRAILSGPKLVEFFNCIMAEGDDVCIDGHAYSIWAGDRITLANVPSIGKKLRATIKADYVAAAKEAGITAYEMQAVTWCAWRRIHSVEG